MVSLPAPPYISSLPSFPYIVSSPSLPYMVLFCSLPIMVSGYIEPSSHCLSSFAAIGVLLYISSIHIKEPSANSILSIPLEFMLPINISFTVIESFVSFIFIKRSHRLAPVLSKVKSFLVIPSLNLMISVPLALC